MIRRCGWCKTVLGTKQADNLPETEVTDGICDECFEEMVAQHEARLGRRARARMPACQRRIL